MFKDTICIKKQIVKYLQKKEIICCSCAKKILHKGRIFYKILLKHFRQLFF